jgi:hypothetical protein
MACGPYEFKIGTTLVGMTLLTELDTPIPGPRPAWAKFGEAVDLGDASRRGFGLPWATWTWDVLSKAQRDQLRTFCSGASAQIYIRTYKRDASEVWANYLVQMIWPDEEEYDRGSVVNFVLLFRDMVEQ